MDFTHCLEQLFVLLDPLFDPLGKELRSSLASLANIEFDLAQDLGPFLRLVIRKQHGLCSKVRPQVVPDHCKLSLLLPEVVPSLHVVDVEVALGEEGFLRQTFDDRVIQPNRRLALCSIIELSIPANNAKSTYVAPHPSERGTDPQHQPF